MIVLLARYLAKPGLGDRVEEALAAHRQAPHYKRIIEETIVPLLERRERQLYRLIEP